MNNILIIVQARYDSTRLPGKVLIEIKGKPLLWYVIKRLELVKHLNKIIIATATSESNKAIIKFAKQNDIDYFVGSEEDVLDRYYHTMKAFKGDVIVRITSDCPLADPDIIDQAISIFLESNCDYVSNVHPPTYPDGYDVEIFSSDALELAWREAELPSEREHVTSYIWKNTDKFSQKNFRNNVDLSSLRLTVDTKEDLLLISKIIENFHDEWNKFKMEDIIHFLSKKPELLKINPQYERNEGYLKSLEKDKEFLKKN